MAKRSPFRYFKISLEVIRLAVMLYIGYPLLLGNVEDMLHERAVDISHETLRYLLSRFGFIRLVCLATTCSVSLTQSALQGFSPYKI